MTNHYAVFTIEYNENTMTNILQKQNESVVKPD